MSNKTELKSVCVNAASCGCCYNIDPFGLARGLRISASAETVLLYMIRRFGYPLMGSDSNKTIGMWLLTTKIEGLYLRVEASTGGMFGFGYSSTLQKELRQGKRVKEVEEALKASLSELLFPVLIDDDGTFFNINGYYDGDLEPVEHSRMINYGLGYFVENKTTEIKEGG